MRILFDLRRVGLGNGGGSFSIINSANTLMDLGHEVIIVDSMKNQHTWIPLKVDHIICNNDRKIPDADVIIATGYKSVKSTINAPSRCGLKAHWIRGFESWVMSEDQMVKEIFRVPTIKLVNGIGLQRKLQEYNCKSYLIMPGYDLDNYKPLGIRENNKKIIIGGLYNEGRGKQKKRTAWLYETAYRLKTKRNDIEFWLFGAHPKPKGFLMDYYIRMPSLKEKNEFYNHINIWLAPTALEGSHIPPAEAMLTGCSVIGTNAKLNGMHDYLTHMQTGLICEDNLESFVEITNKLINNKKLQIQLGKKGRDKILELGSRKQNMIIMVDLLKRLKRENI